MNWHIREAVRAIDSGGVIAYPTETVYGLGCDPFNGAAVLHLLALKQRKMEQGVVLIASDFSQLEPLLLPVTASVKQRVTKARKKPVTWVLPCHASIPTWLRGKHNSLAIRITRHPLAAELCRQCEAPLVSTSANIHGKHPATNPFTVRKTFNDKLDYILHGPRGSGQPSEIRNGITGKVLRNN